MKGGFFKRSLMLTVLDGGAIISEMMQASARESTQDNVSDKGQGLITSDKG
jgi:hypothetical protein